MKKIIFPFTARCHVRQQLLLKELSKWAEVVIADVSHVVENKPYAEMSSISGAYATSFDRYLEQSKPDLVLCRGDRFEILPLAMVSAYREIPIAHIEGFDLSGVIDNKVRYAVSYLSDYHFVTNEESYQRAKSMGFEKVWNFGSLDCEYALSVECPVENKKPSIVVLYHPVPNERTEAIVEALGTFKDYDVIGIKSNNDYGKDSGYKESYSPDEFVRLLKGASCLVGNSSAGIKEAGVLGVPVVNIGSRQSNRLRSHNIIDCQCEKEEIEKAIKKQLEHGKYEIDYTYYQPETSKRISEQLKCLFS